MTSSAYRGRFAPSPTGPLHFGSLVAAVASFADARHHDGQWLVRIEDVDETRCRHGAEQQILQTLLAFGMRWDEAPVRQSARRQLYDVALAQLRDKGMAYRCNCSRRLIATMARAGSEGPIYPGTCRANPPPGDAPAAWRLAVASGDITFTDRVVGETRQDLVDEIGDFVIRRVDGFTAYQLAAVVDDQAQGITDIVRGADLLWSTPRQIWLQRLLKYHTPSYVHIPVITHPDGDKLSKLTGAPAIPTDEVRPMLVAALGALRQSPPGDLETASLDEIWSWARRHWTLEPLRGLAAVRIDEIPGKRLTVTPQLQ